MTIYVTPADGERVLLDTEKAILDYEGTPIKLTGGRLDCYDMAWAVENGTLGADGEPCKVLVLRDQFTGLRIDMPLALHASAAIASALTPAASGGPTEQGGRRLRLRRRRQG